MSEVLGSARRLSRQPDPSARDLKAAIKGLLNEFQHMQNERDHWKALVSTADIMQFPFQRSSK